MKARAKTLLIRLHRVQAAIYDLSIDLEDKGDKYKDASQWATESGFELDVAQERMKSVLKELERLTQKRRSFNEKFEDDASEEIINAYMNGEEA